MSQETTVYDLQPDPRNPRKRDATAKMLIKESVEQYGMGRSVLIDENNMLIAGHGTLEAAKAAGVEKVLIVDADPDTIIAVRRSDLDEHRKVGLGLADNRTAELSDWDAHLLHQLQASGFGDEVSAWFNQQKLDELDIAAQDEEDPTRPPDAFKEVDDDIETEHRCPKCGFEWSGKAA